MIVYVFLYVFMLVNHSLEIEVDTFRIIDLYIESSLCVNM